MKIKIRGCELFASPQSMSGHKVTFPVEVCSSKGEVVVADVDALSALLWSEPRAAATFRNRAELDAYVKGWCAPFGKKITKQDAKAEFCVAQMYGHVAY